MDTKKFKSRNNKVKKQEQTQFKGNNDFDRTD